MSLNCLNTIITDRLAINIDVTKLGSWNLNTGLTINSLTKWNNSISDDLTLVDYGLTAFDNGRASSLNDGIVITQNDNKLSLHRIGFNNNSGGTYYNGYSITSVTGTSVGKYFSLNGGYLQGFFKLDGYNYELLPPRYNDGITIETLVELLPQSNGIFYYMGVRAEDKYNPFFTGETTYISGTTVKYGGNQTGFTYQYSGITTSEGNYLISDTKKFVTLSAFSQPEYAETFIVDNVEQLENIANNLICFEITSNKNLKYSYVDEFGVINVNESPNTIDRVGWTLISVVFKPYDIISDYNPNRYLCYPRRKGDLMFYINGRLFWKIIDFDEFYFNSINNDSEKQIGVPYNISWGGGSFGLKHSWHYSNISGNTITKDPVKDNLFIERYFDSSFIGNIQKLRIYDIALKSDEILHNATIDARSNVNYGILISKGGRIIRQYENVTYIPQQSSGSDIRKSIRYRNNDGSYKNLYQMIDIKVIIKSRTNPNVELVKFKKISEVGWLQLVYMNDTTYDFIVPNTITSQHPNETLFAEIKFQWQDLFDIDGIADKIFIVNITPANLLDNTVKNY